jgi:hypothetical protein
MFLLCWDTEMRKNKMRTIYMGFIEWVVTWLHDWFGLDWLLPIEPTVESFEGPFWVLPRPSWVLLSDSGTKWWLELQSTRGLRQVHLDQQETNTFGTRISFPAQRSDDLWKQCETFVSSLEVVDCWTSLLHPMTGLYSKIIVNRQK